VDNEGCMAVHCLRCAVDCSGFRCTARSWLLKNISHRRGRDYWAQENLRPDIAGSSACDVKPHFHPIFSKIKTFFETITCNVLRCPVF
jgi:hypothetical protein